MYRCHCTSMAGERVNTGGQISFSYDTAPEPDEEQRALRKDLEA